MLHSLKTTVSYIALTFAVSTAALAANTNLNVVVSPPASVQQGNAPAANAQTVDANAKVADNTQEKITEKRKQITSEAIAAVSETRNAVKALDEGKKDDALAALERTTGKLELILARDPQLALAATNVNEVTTSVLADADKVRQFRRTAQSLLDSGQVQAARHLLQGLASETVIRVTNIPLGTYPGAIKQAVKLIDDGKQDDAKKVLQTALNTLVVTDTVIPLPVVATQNMLKDAERLAQKKDRSVDENKKLNDLLTASRGQLEFAEALGYGTRQDFKNLYVQLADITAKTSDGKSGTGFFDHITDSLSTLLRSNQPVAANQSASTAQSQQPSKATAN